MISLKANFIRGLNIKVSEIVILLEKFKGGDRNSYDSLKRITHSLEISSATYGFSEISESSSRASNSDEKTIIINIEQLLKNIEAVLDKEIKDKELILLVGGKDNFKTWVTSALDKRLYHINHAKSTESAQNSINNYDYSLILICLDDKSFDGRSFLTGLKMRETTEEIPVLVLSTNSDLEIEAECISLGSDGFLRLPTFESYLSIVIENILAKARKLKAITRIDVLTGLLNKQAFYEALSKFRNLSLKTHCHISIAMIDIDEMRKINHRYGRTEGDEVIKFISRFILERISPSSVMTRWEGCDFMIIYPDMTKEDVFQELASIQNESTEHNFKFNDGSVKKITFCSGIIELEKTETIEDILIRTGDLVEHLKKEGRNRVSFAKGESVIGEKTILIIEDDIFMADLLRHRLNKSGYLVKTSGNGNEALRIIEDQLFDLVIMDIKLPGIDGFELLTILREKYSPKKLPVIMLSGLSGENNVVRGLKLGANDYIVKPFSTSELLERVNRLVED